MPKQPVRVHIFNQSYTVLADDAAEVQEIAHRIDEMMVSIAGQMASGDSTRVAVLACLHMADRLREAERKLQKFEKKSEAISSLLQTALHEPTA
jgi:cell division protein ZapA